MNASHDTSQDVEEARQATCVALLDALFAAWDALTVFPPKPAPQDDGMGRVNGRHTVTHVLGSYQDVHGPRLRQMNEHLQKHKGAVVACEDPMGIAQSLCMSHPMAAVPYELWMQSRPAEPVANFPELTNGWLVQAAGSVDRLLGAMKAGLTAALDTRIEALKLQRQQIQNGTLPANSRYAIGADGSVRFVSPADHTTAQLAALDAQIAALQAQSDQDALHDPQRTLSEAESMIDRTRMVAFEKLHIVHRNSLEQRLNALNADTIAWLRSESFLAVGDRYDGKAENAGGDGQRFALQLARALINLDTSATGREFLGRDNPFTHARDNLVARMISCDNPAVSVELQTACKALQTTAAAVLDGHATIDPDEARIKLNEELETQLSRFKDAVRSADTFHGLVEGQGKNSAGFGQGTAASFNVLLRIAGSGSWLAVTFSAITLHAAKLPPVQRAGVWLTGRALALSHGLGAEAAKLLKQESLLLAAKLRTNPRYGNKVGLGRAKDWLAKEQQMQALLEQHVTKASQSRSLHGKLLVQGLAMGAEAFAVLAGGGTRLTIRRDLRSAFEASGQLLSAIGSLKDIPADHQCR